MTQDASPTNRRRRYLAELFGTFTLVAIGPGAAMLSARTGAFGNFGIALAFGFAVWLAVAATHSTGGAHINPAVSIGLWTTGRLPGRDVLPYVAMQCVGAIAASVLSVITLGNVGNAGATTPAVPVLAAFSIEAGYSGLLACVVMLLATGARVPRALPPLALGATVFLGAWLTGPLTGGSFNPARSLGPAVSGGIWSAHWLYWFAPVAGMIAVMQLFELVARFRSLSLSRDSG